MLKLRGFSSLAFRLAQGVQESDAFHLDPFPTVFLDLDGAAQDRAHRLQAEVDVWRERCPWMVASVKEEVVKRMDSAATSMN